MIEKNQQVLDFGLLMEETYKEPIKDYSILRNIFLDYIEYIGVNWNEYIKIKTKKEIMEDIRYFNQYIYLPF